MKMKYTAKITFKSLYEDIFDHVFYEDLIMCTSTYGNIKNAFIEKINSNPPKCSLEYDTFTVDIIKEEKCNEFS